MLFCELGQTRKGAAVAIDSCARMWLEICHPHYIILIFSNIQNILISMHVHVHVHAHATIPYETAYS